MAKNASPPTDPAAAMLAAMTPEQRAAYYKALGQEPPAETPPPDSSAAGALAHAPASALVAAPIESYEGASGQGLERAEARDFLTPTLKLLQSMSDEVSQELVPGAAAGSWLLTSTQELWGGADGVRVVPCFYSREYVEYVPRNAGGGFVGVHASSDPIASTFRRVGKRLTNPESGNDIQDTARLFVLVETPTGHQPAIVSLKSTGMKTAKKWLSMIAAQRLQGKAGPFNPPMRAFSYRLSSERVTNDEGTFYVPAIGDAVLVTASAVAEQARAFYDMASRGNAKVAPDEAGPSSAPGAKPGFGDVPKKAGDPF